MGVAAGGCVGSEQAHVLWPLAAPSQKGLGTNSRKQRGCSKGVQGSECMTGHRLVSPAFGPPIFFLEPTIF